MENVELSFSERTNMYGETLLIWKILSATSKTQSKDIKSICLKFHIFF